MNLVAPLVAWLMVMVLVGLAGLFARQQVRTLRSISRNPDLAPADESYLRMQAWRRLAGCALLVAIALMLSAWYLSGWDTNIDKLGDAIQARRAAGGLALTPEQERDKQFYATYWIIVLLLLFALLILMAVDLNAIRRFAARHSRAIRDGRRAMLERELAALRREKRRPRGDPSVN